jgi:hypothetical protein
MPAAMCNMTIMKMMVAVDVSIDDKFSGGIPIFLCGISPIGHENRQFW